MSILTEVLIEEYERCERFEKLYKEKLAENPGTEKYIVGLQRIADDKARILRATEGVYPKPAESRLPIQDYARMKKAIDMAINTLEREARHYCYSDQKEHSNLIAYLENYKYRLDEQFKLRTLWKELREE